MALALRGLHSLAELVLHCADISRHWQQRVLQGLPGLTRLQAGLHVARVVVLENEWGGLYQEPMAEEAVASLADVLADVAGCEELWLSHSRAGLEVEHARVLAGGGLRRLRQLTLDGLGTSLPALALLLLLGGGSLAQMRQLVLERVMLESVAAALMCAHSQLLQQMVGPQAVAQAVRELCAPEGQALARAVLHATYAAKEQELGAAGMAKLVKRAASGKEGMEEREGVAAVRRVLAGLVPDVLPAHKVLALLADLATALQLDRRLARLLAARGYDVPEAWPGLTLQYGQCCIKMDRSTYMC